VESASIRGIILEHARGKEETDRVQGMFGEHVLLVCLFGECFGFVVEHVLIMVGSTNNVFCIWF